MLENIRQEICAKMGVNPSTLRLFELQSQLLNLAKMGVMVTRRQLFVCLDSKVSCEI